jgi:2-oxoglutarate ferredoxin oxidoreductase subunit alpha
MSRVRGGSNSTQIRIASTPVRSMVDQIDLYLPLDQQAFIRMKSRLSQETIVVGDQEQLAVNDPLIDVPFFKIAKEIGNPLYSNTVAVGFILGLLKIDKNKSVSFFESYFKGKDRMIIDENMTAAGQGWDLAENVAKKESIQIEIKPVESVQKDLLLNGAQAVALGALAGGCNFVSSYPMSPSTGVLTFLAERSEEFEIVVEQAEDEISAINMGLGCWYAGGKALATTSGGGFALMVEGISLAGCIESPMVIHLGQRPGPATGLPTRTEQGDLELALYAGHGEFPRAILAPGTVEDAFVCSRHAFKIADQFQVPVIILTDQYLLDTYYNISEFPTPKEPVPNYFVKTDKNYRRYQMTENGISPRGIPGYGDGLVCCDSDEHDENGYITEDLELRTAMVNKRLKKKELLLQECLEPKLIGPSQFDKLIVGWGSTYYTICDAMELKKNSATAFLHLRQVYPFHPLIESYLKRAKEIVVVENNATGQLAKLIRQETGILAHRKVLKYNGLPFSVEEVARQI